MNINTTQAAARLGVNQSRVRQLILAGRLPATKFGRDWMIDSSEIDRLIARRAEQNATVNNVESTITHFS